MCCVALEDVADGFAGEETRKDGHDFLVLGLEVESYQKVFPGPCYILATGGMEESLLTVSLLQNFQYIHI